MARRVSIGYQEFEDIIINDLFYVDKTQFIKEWWERRDRVTLITRPRRFGKTLTFYQNLIFFPYLQPPALLFNIFLNFYVNRSARKCNYHIQ